ncbi:hypothetical protein SAMN06295924_11811 [Rathayibacter rathayi NCPPB 2980 = VKM Ac-1601]|nr:hypothetical protein C5C16_11620 [Rathayibacter rathayi]PPG94143.1 hypothetical protein C5C22_09465 [Rathayibacter rathayi]SOE05910.1 hypothetical protein SAMN06295924_11811 [Rathayibacter rathayi NCPPB 2980 = VKM Ac-1601]
MHAVTAPAPAVDVDTVVEYDIMREAATRLSGFFAARLPDDTSDPAYLAGMQRMIEIRNTARAVPTRDSAEISAATDRFNSELQELRAR